MQWFRNLFPGSIVNRCFPARALASIQQAVADGERAHRGEVCFAVEGALPWQSLWRRQSARERAIEVFGRLKVWDTRENTGILVYVLLSERAIEIVADRGVSSLVDDASWLAICQRLRDRFFAGEFQAGALAAIDEISRLLVEHFPAEEGDNPDELPNRPVLL